MWPVRSPCSPRGRRRTPPGRSSTSTAACTSPPCDETTEQMMASPEPESVTIGGREVPVVTANTVVMGTGSAGFCAAERLWELGQHDVVMVTDKVGAGASRNAGSDKQTYYKLTLSGADGDSVHELSLIHISEPTRLGMISYAVFCLKKKKKKKEKQKTKS